jgi:co-chaperonin GroES (HSP10)
MSKITFKPIADRVLVKPAEAEHTTKGGIIIPQKKNHNVEKWLQ